jgi:hypothetical protein
MLAQPGGYLQRCQVAGVLESRRFTQFQVSENCPKRHGRTSQNKLDMASGQFIHTTPIISPDISLMKTNLFRYLRMTVFGALLVWIPAASAAFIQIPLPDAAYIGSTTLIPITGPDGGTTLTLSDASVTVTFSTLMQKFTAGDTWTTWGSPPAVEMSTPRVLSPADLTITTVTLVFSQPLSIFGLEAEPDALPKYGAFPLTLDFFSGVIPLGTVSNTLDGSSAALFAASSMTPITSVTLTVHGNSTVPEGNDPGIAQIRYALAAPQSVPEGGPSTWLVVATVLALLTVHRFRYARN